MSVKKIGFLPLVSLVIGSQIGAGALNYPSIFASYGLHSLYAWGIAGIGALSLAFIFAKLCSMLPFTGGPHVYVKHAFNHTLAFFTGWTYWIVSWISTTIVLIACVSYIASSLNCHSNLSFLLLGLAIWSIINYINCKSVEQSAFIEIFLTIIKIAFFATFIILPLFYFDINNLAPVAQSTGYFSSAISAALWGFIGLEVATTPAQSVKNPQQTIPKAVFFGTISVAVIYILSIFAALGFCHYSVLINHISPYSIISQQLFNNSHITNICAFFICIGSLNAWVLAAGQISLGLANDKLLPPIFAKLHNNVPIYSILISGFGVAILWILCIQYNLHTFISYLIDCLTPCFVLVYLLCCISFWRLSSGLFNRLITLVAICFCAYMLYTMTLLSLILTILTILSGIPLYFQINKNQLS